VCLGLASEPSWKEYRENRGHLLLGCDAVRFSPAKLTAVCFERAPWVYETYPPRHVPTYEFPCGSGEELTSSVSRDAAHLNKLNDRKHGVQPTHSVPRYRVAHSEREQIGRYIAPVFHRSVDKTSDGCLSHSRIFIEMLFLSSVRGGIIPAGRGIVDMAVFDPVLSAHLPRKHSRAHNRWIVIHIRNYLLDASVNMHKFMHH